MGVSGGVMGPQLDMITERVSRTATRLISNFFPVGIPNVARDHFDFMHKKLAPGFGKSTPNIVRETGASRHYG